MKTNDKHKSKLLKGLNKQVIRQNLKPDFAKVEIYPQILSFSSKHGKYMPLKKKFFNSKWNGMNLKNLYNSLNINRCVGGMYSTFRINTNGKYELTIHGKQILKKKD